MITLSELQIKEVVILETGRRVGFIQDFEIDEKSGRITAFVVATRQIRGNLFNRISETIVPWEQIVTIGDDFILIHDEVSQTSMEKKEKSKEKE
ncbi:MAG TPA: YlmC/YmxH family sporulation protein [Pseudogracilibacillus sp.]|mgnify:CR=1 FL=1|nr:YlmC/YmxH family sporulation protein [Pseudogracilibacillus sp.]